MSDKNNKTSKENKSDMEFLDSLLHQQNTRTTRSSKGSGNTGPHVVRNTETRQQRTTTGMSTRSQTGTVSTKRDTSGIPVTRQTGTVSTKRDTSGIPVTRQTGTVSTKRNTSGIPVTRQTGTVSTKRNTSSIPVTRQTGTVSTKRTTGIHTPHSTGTIPTRRTTGATARYSYDDDDLYARNDDSSAVIYTAGTNLFWVILIAIMIWLIVSIAQASPSQSVVSSYSQRTGLRAVAQIIGIQLPDPTAVPIPIVIPIGESSILGSPTITAAQIDAILLANNSPAAGTGEIWVEAGLQYGIDPIYGIAFFMHESGYGTNPLWVGIKPDGSTTHNVGNIICANYRTCYKKFRDYPDWRTGIYDWYRLIAIEYVQGRGIATVESILPIYAPAFENDVPQYIATIKYAVAEWRQTNLVETP